MINMLGPKASILLDWETLPVFFLKSEDQDAPYVQNS